MTWSGYLKEHDVSVGGGGGERGAVGREGGVHQVGGVPARGQRARAARQRTRAPHPLRARHGPRDHAHVPDAGWGQYQTSIESVARFALS